MKLTKLQIEAVKRGEAVRVRSAEVGGEVVLLNTNAYAEIEAILRDKLAKDELGSAVRRSLDTWALENPF
jgi:hypothetical protein